MIPLFHILKSDAFASTQAAFRLGDAFQEAFVVFEFVIEPNFFGTAP